MTVSKYQKFETKEIHRQSIKNAPYNPRKIGEAERKRLKGNLKKVGLLEPLVWNELTGNLVSGHRRLEILDALEGSDDYYLTFSVVQLDDKTEKEQNIFFNSTSAQGEFDFEKLKDLVKFNNLDVDGCGLSLYDLSIINITTEELNRFGANISNEVDTESESEPDEDIEPLTYEDKKQLIKDEKDRIKNSYINTVDEGETYITLSFSSYDAKAAFCKRFDIPSGEVIYKGEIFSQMIERIK